MFAFSQVILGTQCLLTDLASRNKSSKTCHESSEPMSYLIFVLKNTLDLKRVLTSRVIYESYLIGFIKFFWCDKRLSNCQSLQNRKEELIYCITLFHKLSY